ncbi:hypothetical protein LWI28_009104 [Acer negundo]|uniref:Uncharacterized protein n=1 Tax=Acer negundo TaxID=4023 RepID=A0AAD5IQL7_ACENE|nr:hypothetical protein LWI28_009104 [Acer negundo]
MSDIPISSDSIGIANISTEDEIASARALNDHAPLVNSHLLKIEGGGIASCSRVTNANISEMQKVVGEAELRVKESLPSQVLLPITSSHNKTIGSSNSITYHGLDSDLPSIDPKNRKGIS